MRSVALVTGSSRGIGLGIALALANEGCDVVINGIRPQSDVEAVLAELGETGSKAIYCQADISIREDRIRLIETIRQTYGALNILVNNAGVAPLVRADILESSEESFERVMKINLEGPYFLTQLAARWMVEQKLVNPNFDGCIINITSVSAVYASTNRGEYCISKAGMSMATKLWAVRLGEYGIPVYEIRPGVIKTDMTAKVREAYEKRFQEGLALQKRWGMPEDIGKAAAMLVRGDLPYSTGAVITVDGGLSVERL